MPHGMPSLKITKLGANKPFSSKDTICYSCNNASSYFKNSPF
jgi:hypothetical protein